MTHSAQPLSRSIIENSENIGETGAEVGACDVLSVCDSLNKLYETLSRLDYALQRKNNEIKNITKNGKVE